jgi:hypothetical protein
VSFSLFKTCSSFLWKLSSSCDSLIPCSKAINFPFREAGLLERELSALVRYVINYIPAPYYTVDLPPRVYPYC